MDDPGSAWPAWKFGMKRDDLFTKLHDQYNTFASTIQDPEAFHHDVYELSQIASNADEFHRLMGERKQQRLHELNHSLDSVAMEIIGNPNHIGDEQWQYALQLFRTKSLDSLVRYFASYLAEHSMNSINNCGYQTASSLASSFTDRCSVNTASTDASSVDEANCPSFFGNEEDKPILTHEPLTIVTSSTLTSTTSPSHADLPPSPRSMTMHSDESAPSPRDLDDHYGHQVPTPARTLSFSGSESGQFGLDSSHLLRRNAHDSSHLLDPGTPATSVSDVSEHPSSQEESKSYEELHEGIEEDEFPPAQFPTDSWEIIESETPTPRQEPIRLSYLDSKTLCSRRIPSPRLRRRDASPSHLRRTPDESLNRIQKPVVDLTRTRPKCRRRRQEC
jgi:hypothetical protein